MSAKKTTEAEDPLAGHELPEPEPTTTGVDRRFFAIARTDWQRGCQALSRAIAKPTSFALVLILALLSSCVATSGDLAKVQTAMQEQETKSQAALAALQAGQITQEEYLEAIKDAWGNTAAEVGEVAEDVADRGAAIGDTLLTIAASLLIGVPTSMKATNMVRDNARVRRHEAVG